MKTLFPILLGASLLLTGCASKSSAKKREQQAFLMGQQQGIAAQSAAQQPFVSFRGAVRHARVPWTENMTLTQALAAAEYTGTLDPRTIKVIRQGQVHFVNPKALLRGQDDPELLPGDIVEVSR